ncbi:MAG: hypothetical protein LAN62_07160 [Acidobacteriia bacterium]|nr:hypothetical protein [Terriglobia bacterium]
MRPAPSASRRPGRATSGNPSFLSNIPQTLCLADPYNMGGITCRSHYPGQQSAFNAPLIVPYYIGYSPSDYQPVEEPSAPQPDQTEMLAGQIEKLTQAVESLQEERAAREPAQASAVAPRAAAQQEFVPLALVYRDGRRAEVQNYAILGQTLWVFAGQATRRIALADLDLKATEKLNDERGVEFLPPDLSYRN